MFLTQEAMRYYRVWIYTCNAVLFVSVFVFCCAAFYVLSDGRRHLVSSVQLYHPSFLYAYVAILVQGGIVQVIGCIGALKLNERLLNTYWLILLGLLIGDVIVGGIWMVKFDHLTSGLAPNLHKRLQTEYASNQGNFRHLFDDLQSESQCCGVDNPKDYNATWWQPVEQEYFLDYEKLTNHTDENFLDDFEDDDDELDRNDILLPWSCCVAERLVEEPSAMANKIRGRLQAKGDNDPKSSRGEDEDENEVPLFPGTSVPNGRRRYYILKKKGTKGFLTPEEKLLYGDEPIFMQGKWCTYSPLGSDWHYDTGCVVPLAAWVKSGGDALFVIGLCVVAFVKFTFLSILRYEIKEMIQKIKLMQNETQQMNGELATALGLNNHSEATSSSTSSIASTTPQVASKLGKFERSDSRQLKVTKPAHNTTSNDVRQISNNPPLQTQLPPVQQQQQQQHMPKQQPQQHSHTSPPRHVCSPPNDSSLKLQQTSHKLIDTGEPLIVSPHQDWQTCSSRKQHHHQPQQQQHELSDFVSPPHLHHSNNDKVQSSKQTLGQKTFGQSDDTTWCTFRPIQPEPTSRDDISVCMNNFHSVTSTTTATSDTSGFRGGSSRQTAI